MWTGQAMTEAYCTVVGEQPDSEDGEDLSEGMFPEGPHTHLSPRECSLQSLGIFT